MLKLSCSRRFAFLSLASVLILLFGLIGPNVAAPAPAAASAISRVGTVDKSGTPSTSPAPITLTDAQLFAGGVAKETKEPAPQWKSVSKPAAKPKENVASALSAKPLAASANLVSGPDELDILSANASQENSCAVQSLSNGSPATLCGFIYIN